MATVGFGDIVAATLLGRLCVMVYIASGLVLTGSIIGSVVALLSQRNEGAGRVVNAASRPLVLFTGEASLGQLEEILTELFPPHARAAVARLQLHAVLLLDGESFRRELPAYFAAHPEFATRVTVLSGSVLDRAALVRAGAHTPEMQAAIVLQRRFARNAFFAEKNPSIVNFPVNNLEMKSYVSPEAAVGGGLALLKTGDRIRIDLNTRKVDVMIPEAEMAARRAAWVAPVLQHQTPWEEIFRSMVGQMGTGACLEPATLYLNILETRGESRNNH